jgi:hypothetical protein
MRIVTASIMLISMSFLLAGSCGPHHTPSTAAGYQGAKPCTANEDCTGVYACFTYQSPSKCVGGKCVATLTEYPPKESQCAPGHVRKALMSDGSPAIQTCSSACDWNAPVACGTPAGAPCCLGGCNAPLTCSAVVGGSCG